MQNWVWVLINTFARPGRHAANLVQRDMARATDRGMPGVSTIDTAHSGAVVENQPLGSTELRRKFRDDNAVGLMSTQHCAGEMTVFDAPTSHTIHLQRSESRHGTDWQRPDRF